MAMISYAGENAGITEKGTYDRIINLLKKFDMKTADTHTVSEIIEAMANDKKRTGDSIKFIMLNKIGESFINPVLMNDISRIFGV